MTNSSTGLLLKDVIQMYIGCRVQVDGKEYGRLVGGDYVPNEVNQIYHNILIDGIEDDIIIPYNDDCGNKSRIKPLLRPLSDMTQEEAKHFAWLCMNSRYHLDEENQVDEDEIEIDFVKNDNGTLLDDDIEIFIGVACRCFEGAVLIRKDGDIAVVDEDGKIGRGIDDISFKVIYLIKQEFDLFDLIKSGQAIDKNSI